MKKMIFMALMLCLMSIRGFAQTGYSYEVYGKSNIITYVSGKGYYVISAPTSGGNKAVSILLGAEKSTAIHKLHTLMNLKNNETAIVEGLGGTHTKVYRKGGIKAETIGGDNTIHPFRGIHEYEAVLFIMDFYSPEEHQPVMSGGVKNTIMN